MSLTTLSRSHETTPDVTLRASRSSSTCNDRRAPAMHFSMDVWYELESEFPFPSMRSKVPARPRGKLERVCRMARSVFSSQIVSNCSETQRNLHVSATEFKKKKEKDFSNTYIPSAPSRSLLRISPMISGCPTTRFPDSSRRSSSESTYTSMSGLKCGMVSTKSDLTPRNSDRKG